MNFELMTLADFIASMRLWPQGELQKVAYGLGQKKALSRMRSHYQILSVWLEYYLLHRRELGSLLFHSAQYLPLKPQADLSTATHDFITRHFYPRDGANWKEFAPTADHLWALVEYSQCYREAKGLLQGTGPRKKGELLDGLYQAVITARECLDSGITSISPYYRQGMSLVDLRRAEKDGLAAIANRQKDACLDPLAFIFELVMQRTESLIEGGDYSLKRHFKLYLKHWDIYRSEASRTPALQVLYLPSPDEDPRYSEKGKRAKGFSPMPRRGRGRPPKGYKGGTM